MYTRYEKDEGKLLEENRYLQDQLDESNRRAEQEREKRQHDEESRRRERQEYYDERLRTPDSWPEALQKQIYLMGAEARQEVADNDPDHYFSDGVKACQRALEIWTEIEARKQDEIYALLAQIKAIEAEICQTVAERLDTESTKQGWRSISNSLRYETPESFLNW